MKLAICFTLMVGLAIQPSYTHPTVLKRDESGNSNFDAENECKDPNDATGIYYRGIISHTTSGHMCQMWTSHVPNSHPFTSEEYPDTGLGDHNYCRNPDGGSGPWCYNGEGTEPRWEYCEIPDCEEAEECRDTNDETGVDYRGTVSQTVSGHVCQRWTSQEPNSHTVTSEEHPDTGLGDHNYCRNPDGGSGPWCYNGEGTEPRWEYCDIPDCEEAEECRDTNDETGVDYRGTVSQTVSGHACQRWTSQEPNSHTVTSDEYPDTGLGDHNYCRNPDGGSGPWCYNGEGTEPRWEYCEIPECTSECGWEETEGTEGYEKSAAMDMCEQDEVCAAVICDGEYFCWLSNDAADPASLAYGVYIKDCTSGGVEVGEDDDESGSEESDFDECETFKWEVKFKGTEIYIEENAKAKCEISGECKGISCENPNNCWLNMKSACGFEKSYTVYAKTCDSTPDDEYELPDYNQNETGKDCRESEDSTGSSYRGTISHTTSGHVCQKWTSQEPNSHTVTSEEYPDTGLGDHNYCRNPDGGSGPWCYNGEGTEPRWEYCEIPVCPTCEWEEVVEGSVTQSKEEARDSCKESDDCKAFVCKGEEDCWLNNDTAGVSEKILTQYNKITFCHE